MQDSFASGSGCQLGIGVDIIHRQTWKEMVIDLRDGSGDASIAAST